MYKPSITFAKVIISVVAMQKSPPIFEFTVSKLLSGATLLQSTGPGDDKPSTNYLGASIFVLYIVAALALTKSICSSLIHQYHEQKRTHHVLKNGNRLKFLCTFSAISFAMLSYNMLMYLITSYLNWERHLVGSKTLFQAAAILPRRIWLWMTTTPLFTEFARELFAGPEEAWWSECALNIALALLVDMGVRGERYKIKGLWRYIALAEILPPSFAANLLYLAGTLHQPSTSKDKASSHPTSAADTKPISTDTKLSNSQHSPEVNTSTPADTEATSSAATATTNPTRTTIAYLLCILALMATYRPTVAALSSHAHTPFLVSFIFALRLLLILAATMPLWPDEAVSAVECSSYAATCLFGSAFGDIALRAWRERSEGRGMFAALTALSWLSTTSSSGSPLYAVRALGCDAVLVCAEMAMATLWMVVEICRGGRGVAREYGFRV